MAGVEVDTIHIARDGRDAAVSAVHHSWNFGKSRKKNAGTPVSDLRGRERPARACSREAPSRRWRAEWGERVGRTVEDGPVLLGSNYAEVRYEDLLQRPEEEMARLLTFLGAGTDEEVVKRCVSAASFERLSKGRKRGEEDQSSFFRKGVAGDWRNVFTEEDRHIFKREAGGLLIKLSYEKSDDW